MTLRYQPQEDEPLTFLDIKAASKGSASAATARACFFDVNSGSHTDPSILAFYISPMRDPCGSRKVSTAQGVACASRAGKMSKGTATPCACKCARMHACGGGSAQPMRYVACTPVHLAAHFTAYGLPPSPPVRAQAWACLQR